MDKTAYRFHRNTKEYMGEVIAQESPRRPGTWFLPGDSTYTEPPAAQEGYARVWDGTSAWIQVEDHRGQTIWKDYDTSDVVKELGPIPEGWSTTRPNPPPPTKQELAEYTYSAKCEVAYTYITVIQNGIDYRFETNETSITMCNSKLSVLEDGETTNWKVYKDDFPTLITLTRAELKQIFKFGSNVTDTAFQYENEFNTEIAAMTEEQRSSEEYITDFKARVDAKFAEINKTITLE